MAQTVQRKKGPSLLELYRGNVSAKTIPMDDAERERSEFVLERYVTMHFARETVENQIHLGKQLYEEYEFHLERGGVWNEPYRFAELFGAIQRKHAELVEALPEAKAKATKDNAQEVAIQMQATLKQTEANAMSQKVAALLDSLMYPAGIVFESYAKLTKKITPVKGNELNLPKGKEEEVEIFNDLVTERVDPRDFFVDEAANVFYDRSGVNGARDCIRRRVVPYSLFKDIYKDYKNADHVTSVTWGAGSYGRSKRPFQKESEEQKTTTAVVEVLEYWNHEKDMVSFIANGIEIYHGAIPFKHKRLPFTMYYNYRRDDSVWGISEALILAPYIQLEEELVNLMIYDAKIELQPVIAVDADVSLDSEEYQLEPGAIWELRGLKGGKVTDSIQELRFGGITDSALKVREIIEDKRIITTSDDTRALWANPNQQATQTLQKREVAMKRIKANSLQNTIESEKNRVEMRVSNIAQFWAQPFKDATGKVQFRRVFIEGYEIRQTRDEDKPIFKQKYGAQGYFSLSPDSIKGYQDVEIEIVDSSKDEMLKKHELENKIRLFETLAATVQFDPTITQRMSMVGYIKEIARDMDVDFDAVFPRHEEITRDPIDIQLELVQMGITPPVAVNVEAFEALDRYMKYMKSKAYKKANAQVKKALNELIQLTAQYVEVQLREKLDRYNIQPQGGNQVSLEGEEGSSGEVPPLQLPGLNGGAGGNQGEIASPRGVATRLGFKQNRGASGGIATSPGY